MHEASNIWATQLLFHFLSVTGVAGGVGCSEVVYTLTQPAHLHPPSSSISPRRLQQRVIHLCPTIWDSNIKSYLTEIVFYKKKKKELKKKTTQTGGRRMMGRGDLAGGWEGRRVGGAQGRGERLAGGQDVDKCKANAERTEGRKMAVTGRSQRLANIIRGGKHQRRGGMCNLRLGCSTSKEKRINSGCG